jgi:hypothetical protein
MLERDILLVVVGGSIGIIGGVLGAAVEAVLSYKLGNRRDRKRRKRENYEAALRYHKTRESLRLRDLAGLDLAEVDLEAADLYGADLSNAGLWGADFRAANLITANLKDALAPRAKFQQASLVFANLNGADLHDAGLEYADLRGASLLRANLKDARLAEAILDDSTAMPEGWESVVASGPEHKGPGATLYR